MSTTIGFSLDRASIDLFSDYKKERVVARNQLLKLTDSFQNIPKVRGEFPMWGWLAEWVQAAIDKQEFPYEIDETKAGEIYKTKLIRQREIPETDKIVPENPAYIVNMAHASKPLKPEAIVRQIELLKEGGFNERSEVAKRLRIVVGANFCYSIDAAKNKLHKAYFNHLSESLTLGQS